MVWLDSKASFRACRKMDRLPDSVVFLPQHVYVIWRAESLWSIYYLSRAVGVFSLSYWLMDASQAS